MHEGTPFLPGSTPGHPEGVAAHAVRPRLQLIQGRGRGKVVPLEARRAHQRGTRPTLLGVAVASAAGVLAAVFWCALLAFIGFQLRPRLGDGGAFALVLGIQLAATAAAFAMARGRTALRSVLWREGISSRC